MEGLGAGALPAVTSFSLIRVCIGDAGASALAAALDRGTLQRLKELTLCYAALSDAGLVALAPALQRLPALEQLNLDRNPFGDEGLAALVAPPPPAGALPLPAGGLKKVELLDLLYTRVSDSGCATLAAALASGALPALEELELDSVNGIPASDEAIEAVYEALARSRAAALAKAAGPLGAG